MEDQNIEKLLSQLNASLAGTGIVASIDNDEPITISMSGQGITVTYGDNA